jgi:hypothetical protein
MPMARIFAGALALLVALGAFLLLRSRDANPRSDEEPELSSVDEEAAERAPLLAPSLSTSREVAAEVPSSESPSRETPSSSAARRASGAPDDVLVEIRDPADRLVRHLGLKLYLRSVVDPDQGILGSHHFGRLPEGAEGPHRIPRKAIEPHWARAKKAGRLPDGRARAELYLAVDAPSAPCSEHLLEEGQWPTGVVVLRLGLAGSMRVEVLDGTGSPLVRELRLRLTEQPGAAAEPGAERRVTRERCSDGSCLFDPLRLGARFELEVQDASGRLHAETLALDGPRVAGECVEAKVRLTREAVLVVGRALDESGAPLASQDLSFSAHSPSGGVSVQIRTDAAGRFEVPWSNQLARFSGVESVELTRRRAQGRDAVTDRVRVLLPKLPETGAIDLGELRLVGESALELLASGVVVDGEGRPVAEASLNVWEVWPPKQEGPWDEWRMLNDEFFRCDAEGRFELRSRHRVRALRLSPQATGYVPEKNLTVEQGATGVRLVLRRGATLAGRVLLPATLRHDQVYVIPHDGTRSHEYAQIDAEGRFRTRALKPGTYRFDVLSSGRLVASVADVPLEEGAENRAAALDPLDLREALRLWKLRVLDGAGEPLAQHRCFAADGRVDRFLAYAQTDDAGRLALWTARDDDALTLVAAGFLSQDVLWRESEQELRLAAASPHRFRVSGCGDLDAEFRISVSLRAPAAEPVDPRVRASASAIGDQKYVREGEILERAIAVPGRYEHRWTLHSVLNEQWVEFATHELELGLDPPAEPVEIAVSREALERAIAELRRRKVR